MRIGGLFTPHVCTSCCAPTNLSFGDLAQQIFMPNIPHSVQAFAGETIKYVSGSNGSLEESATSRQDARRETFPELRKVTLRLRP